MGAPVVTKLERIPTCPALCSDRELPQETDRIDSGLVDRTGDGGAGGNEITQMPIAQTEPGLVDLLRLVELQAEQLAYWYE